MTRGGNDAEPTALEDEGGPTVDYDGGLQAVAEANRVAVFHGGASGAPAPARGAGVGVAPGEAMPSRSAGEGAAPPVGKAG